MAVYSGPESERRRVEVCAVGCEGAQLNKTLQDLNENGWSVRQIYQEAPTTYRIFAQRETPA